MTIDLYWVDILAEGIWTRGGFGDERECGCDTHFWALWLFCLRVRFHGPIGCYVIISETKEAFAMTSEGSCVVDFSSMITFLIQK